MVTEETIGDLINQRWCTVENATACLGHATYAITWQTYLQSSFNEGDAAFYKLMKGATAITSFSGAAGTATVWKLRDHSMKIKWILAGVALTAAVTACSFGGARGQASVLSTNISIALPEGSLGSNGPVVGVNLYAVTNYTAAQTTADGERTLSYIKNTLHASAVDLVWNLYSPGYYSNSVVTNKNTTLTAANIAILTKIAQRDGLYVEYRPLIFVETKGNNWEGLLEPSNPAKWFDSYYEQNLPYLKMAQKYHINEYVIGTEMKRVDPGQAVEELPGQVGQDFPGPDQLRAEPVRLLPPAHRSPADELTGVDMYEPLRTCPRRLRSSKVEAAYDKFFAETPTVDPAQERHPGDGHRGPRGRLPEPAEPDADGNARPDHSVQLVHRGLRGRQALPPAGDLLLEGRPGR